MRRAPESVSATGDLLYGWLYAAGIGGSVAALFFLLTDSLTGHPLLTPSILGSVVFFGAKASAVTSVNLHGVVLFTLVHFVAFGGMGLIASLLFPAVRVRGGAPTVVTAVVMFVLMEGTFLVASATVMPGVLPRLGRGLVMAANALTAVSMAYFLRLTYAGDDGEEADRPEEREEELMETPGLI